MASYPHEVSKRRFRIDVTAVQADSTRPNIFVATVTRVDRTRPTPVVRLDNGEREIYGPSEAWALSNARALLDEGSWRERRTS
jgi:hypothetical protein